MKPFILNSVVAALTTVLALAIIYTLRWNYIQNPWDWTDWIGISVSALLVYVTAYAAMDEI